MIIDEAVCLLNCDHVLIREYNRKGQRNKSITAKQLAKHLEEQHQEFVLNCFVLKEKQ